MSSFATLLTVMRKELRDLSRDRRTLALTLLLGPLLYPVLILGMSKLAESRVKTQIEQPLDIPMIGGEHAPNLVRFLAAQGLNATEAPKDLTDAIRSQRIDVALRISPAFGKDWSEAVRRWSRSSRTVPAVLPIFPAAGWRRRWAATASRSVRCVCWRAGSIRRSRDRWMSPRRIWRRLKPSAG